MPDQAGWSSGAGGEEGREAGGRGACKAVRGRAVCAAPCPPSPRRPRPAQACPGPTDGRASTSSSRRCRRAPCGPWAAQQEPLQGARGPGAGGRGRVWGPGPRAASTSPGTIFSRTASGWSALSASSSAAMSALSSGLVSGTAAALMALTSQSFLQRRAGGRAGEGVHSWLESRKAAEPKQQTSCGMEPRQRPRHTVLPAAAVHTPYVPYTMPCDVTGEEGCGMEGG